MPLAGSYAFAIEGPEGPVTGALLGDGDNRPAAELAIFYSGRPELSLGVDMQVQFMGDDTRSLAAAKIVYYW